MTILKYYFFSNYSHWKRHFLNFILKNFELVGRKNSEKRYNDIVPCFSGINYYFDHSHIVKWTLSFKIIQKHSSSSEPARDRNLTKMQREHIRTLNIYILYTYLFWPHFHLIWFRECSDFRWLCFWMIINCEEWKWKFTWKFCIREWPK